MAVTRVRLPDWERDPKHDCRLDLSVAELDLPVRVVNFLEENGIFTVGALLNCTVERLLAIKNVGLTTVKTIFAALKKIGFYPARKEGQNDGHAEHVQACHGGTSSTVSRG